MYFLPFLLEQASVSPLWEPRSTSIVLTEIGLYRVLRLETEDGSNYWIEQYQIKNMHFSSNGEKMAQIKRFKTKQNETQ